MTCSLCAGGFFSLKPLQNGVMKGPGPGGSQVFVLKPLLAGDRAGPRSSGHLDTVTLIPKKLAGLYS